MHNLQIAISLIGFFNDPETEGEHPLIEFSRSGQRWRAKRARVGPFKPPRIAKSGSANAMAGTILEPGVTAELVRMLSA